MTWNNIKRLHVELSSDCNAACPNCARHPTGSYYINPTIKKGSKWTIEETKKRLPSEDLKDLEFIHINGVFGDFITNNDAIPIIRYFRESAPSAFISCNTNGSARNKKWWSELGSIPNINVTFALDGLSDTHHLYRRDTDWHTIIENATTYINAGGYATWQMIVFEHNKHQIEECENISKRLGFKRFSHKNTDRPSIIVRDRNGEYSHQINRVDVIDFNTKKTISSLRKIEELLKSGTFNINPKIDKLPLSDKSDCLSVSMRKVYIDSNWMVMPCCVIGSIAAQGSIDDRYNDFKKDLEDNNLLLDNFIATDDISVRNIYENIGFNWIIDNVTTDNIQSGCYLRCGKNSLFKNSRDKETRKNF
jgi:hypothetical protein